MKALILAAGYATRLYPLTLTQPKPLLPVAGKPMIEHVIDNLAPIAGLDEVLVVSNDKFAGHFQRWAETYVTRQAKLRFKVINDGSTSDETKLGAIGDIHLVLSRENVEEDLIVVAGDNLFSRSLEDFGRFGREKSAVVVATYTAASLDDVKKFNTLELDADGRVRHFEEKPASPTNLLTAIALYYYPRHALPLIRQYVTEGNNPDQPGRLVQWLYTRVPVYTWPVPGIWFDIGSKESLEEANTLFANLGVGL